MTCYCSFATEGCQTRTFVLIVVRAHVYFKPLLFCYVLYMYLFDILYDN